MRLTRCLLLLLIVAACGLVATNSAYCGEAKNEATFAATFDNPKEGDSSWAATGEVLVPVGHSPFLIGPSIQLFDTGPTDGGALGGTVEMNFGKKSGLFGGLSIVKLAGDAADLAEYQGEGRVGLKLGTEGWFAKVYASQTWSRDKAGAVTDPDRTSFVAGIGARF